MAEATGDTSISQSSVVLLASFQALAIGGGLPLKAKEHHGTLYREAIEFKLPE